MSPRKSVGVITITKTVQITQTSLNFRLPNDPYAERVVQFKSFLHIVHLDYQIRHARSWGVQTFLRCYLPGSCET